MDVAVHYERGQRRPREGGALRRLFGAGLLERARAMSLALLGLVAAVGLAIVAVALNQGWPLVAGSAIPRIPPRYQDVGRASIVAAGTSDSGGGRRAAVARTAPAGPAASAAGDGGTPPGSPAAGRTRFVVSPSAPVSSGGGTSPSSPAGQKPAPAGGQPNGAPSAPASPQARPPAAPAGPSNETPSTPSTPSATISEAPDDAGVPAWSNGKGHAYGRGADDGGHEDGWSGGHGRDGD